MSLLSRTKMFQHSFLEAHIKITNKHLITLFLWALSLQMKENIPWFSSLNDASPEEVIVALTYGIVHTYLMLWTWERCQKFISPSAISYEHLHQLNVLMCRPCSIPFAFQTVIYAGSPLPLEIDVRLLSMTIHEKCGQLRAPSTPAEWVGQPLGEKCDLLVINLKKRKHKYS